MIPPAYRRPVSEMYCDCVDAQSVHHVWDWSGEEWEESIIFPSSVDLTFEEIRRKVVDIGTAPSVDPFCPKTSPAQLMEILEEYGIEPDAAVHDPEAPTAQVKAILLRQLLDWEDLGESSFFKEWEETYLELTREDMDGYTPIMNYYWPLGRLTHEEDYQAVLDLYGGSTCLVRVDDEVVLGLVGGGMNLSWELVQAYCLLGFLPPFDLASRLPLMAGLRLDDEIEWLLQACERSVEVMVARIENGASHIKRVREWLKERA